MAEVQSEASVHDLIGTVIAGRYRIDKLLGEGGMGAVYRGFHLHLRRDFAIKVLHPDVTRDPEISRRFEREAQSAARLDHPNCIQVTEFGTTDDGIKYMVMQLLEGIELQDLVRGPLELTRALDFIVQILSGLEHAHAKGVVHRDLKPQNVFVTRDASGKELLKIVDFGIAKIVAGEGAGEQMTRAGLVFGTPLYMSPEQCLGVDVDGRTDLYSTGILLYFMLSGKLPFYGDDPVAVIRMQVSQEPPPLPPSVPADLAAIVRRLLAKQRDQRFPDAATARKVLEGYRKTLVSSGGKGIDATRVVTTLPTSDNFHETLPEGVRPRPLTTFEIITDRRSGRTFWYGAGALVLIGGLILVILFSGTQTPHEKEPETAPTTGAEATSLPSEAPEKSPEGPPEGPPTAPSEAELAEVDRHFAASDYDAGALALGKLRERFPEHAGLLWREGWLVNWRDRDAVAAFERYRDALERDPELAQNAAFAAELGEILAHPELRSQAVDVAIALGDAGRPLLLSFVNDTNLMLGYPSRRRALQALASDPESAAAVDKTLNLIRDVEQHREAPRPCVALTEAVNGILAAPAGAFYEPLVDASPPKVVPGAAPEEAAACAALPKLLEKARKKLKPLVKKKKKPTKKKGVFKR